jgi:hypothetical protein
MAYKVDDFEAPKISREFEARVGRLKPEQKIRAVVMLQTPKVESPSGQQQARKNRQAIIKSIRQTADLALSDIDAILERFGGKRLTDRVNTLATILIETTPAGIRALAASEHVKAIVEDQPIAPFPKLKRVL